MENLASVFADDRKVAQQKRQQEQKMEQLYSQVGKLTTQLEWIKKRFLREFGDRHVRGRVPVDTVRQENERQV